jgi:H(+)-transporting ATP synthase subunit D
VTRSTRVAATRSNLMRCRRRLDQVRKGAALLKRKRESLVNELFARARGAVTSRDAIDRQAREAFQALWEALGATGSEALAPLGWPPRHVDVDLTAVELWGLRAAALAGRPSLVRSLAARGILPGPAEAATQTAARAFEVLAEQLIEAAPQEHLMRRLGQALSRTTRLVNTLEQRVAVALAADAATIRRTLEEREREERQRIKRLIARRQSRLQ